MSDLRISSAALRRTAVSLVLFCGTLLHSGRSDSNTGWVPHPLVIQVGQLAVYATYFGLIVYFTLSFIKGGSRLYRGGYVYVGMAYAFLFAIALAHTDDVLRYFLLAAFSLCIPQALADIQRKKGHEKVISDGMQAWALIYILMSAAGYVLNDAPSGRLSGYMTNPNSFGFSIVIALLFTLFIGRYSLARRIVVALIAFYLIHATGSRLSALAAAVVILYWIATKANSARTSFLSILLCITMACIYFLVTNADDNDRSLQFASAFSDSGRDVLYQEAVQAIARNPVLGHGMTAHEVLLGTGNIHSSFIRLGFMVGIPLAGIFFLIYACGLFVVFKKAFKGSVLRPFVLILPLFLIGEDYVVGVGSFFYLVLLVMMSFSIQRDDDSRWRR
jgi:hypothetical protein